MSTIAKQKLNIFKTYGRDIEGFSLFKKEEILQGAIKIDKVDENLYDSTILVTYDDGSQIKLMNPNQSDLPVHLILIIPQNYDICEWGLK